MTYESKDKEEQGGVGRVAQTRPQEYRKQGQRQAFEAGRDRLKVYPNTEAPKPVDPSSKYKNIKFVSPGTKVKLICWYLSTLSIIRRILLPYTDYRVLCDQS